MSDQTHNITWSKSGSIGSHVKLEYIGGSGSWKSIRTVETNELSYTWTIPDDAATDCRVKVVSTRDSSIYDISNDDFTIRKPATNSLTVTSPNGGEIWDVGSTHNITWSKSGSIGSHVKLEYIGGSGSWKSIRTVETNELSYTWTIPDDAATDCRVKVVSTRDSSIYDISNDDFTIRKPATNSLTVTSPNGGEIWDVGSTHNITWSKLNNTGRWVWLEYSTDGGTTWTIDGSSSNDGSYPWTIPDDVSTRCLVKVTSTSWASDISDNNFTIRKQVSKTMTVTSPNGGEVWDIGSTHDITWSETGDNGSGVWLDYSTDGGNNWEEIDSAFNNGSYSWTVPDDTSMSCRVRVKSSKWNGGGDISDNNFTIREQISNSLTVTSPNGGTGMGCRINSQYHVVKVREHR